MEKKSIARAANTSVSTESACLYQHLMLKCKWDITSILFHTHFLLYTKKSLPMRRRRSNDITRASRAGDHSISDSSVPSQINSLEE